MPVPQLVEGLKVEFPSSQILVVTLCRNDYNMLNQALQHKLNELLDWFDITDANRDLEASRLRVAIIAATGKGWCCGADLKEWLVNNAAGKTFNAPSGGFGGISRRISKKPIIAAVQGLCLGGGTEMVVNCDLVVAAKSAQFGLPEVKRGVFAKMGALGRIVRHLGLQRASELALIGEPISAQQGQEWGFINRVVEREQVLPTALDLAHRICANSPDSVIVSKTGMQFAQEIGSLERSTQVHNDSSFVRGLEQGENIAEGLAAFKEKRETRWRDSKL
ncbi:hypothetical protein PYCC9005_000767 [Savitreella phatthalungensis]